MNKKSKNSTEIIPQTVIHRDGYESPVRRGLFGFVLGLLDNMRHDQPPIQFFLEPLKTDINKENLFFSLMFLFIYVFCGILFLNGLCSIVVGTMLRNPVVVIHGFFFIFVFHLLFNVALFNTSDFVSFDRGEDV